MRCPPGVPSESVPQRSADNAPLTSSRADDRENAVTLAYFVIHPATEVKPAVPLRAVCTTTVTSPRGAGMSSHASLTSG